MTLTLVSVEDDYIVRDDGHVTTPGPVFVDLEFWDDFDLIGAWQDAARAVRDETGQWWRIPNRDEFRAQVQRAVADSDAVAYDWCEACSDPVKDGEGVALDDGVACESCYEETYRTCEDCGAVVHRDYIYYVGDAGVCDSCRDRNYSYCEDCDEYYHSDDSDEHRHGECDCESPAQVFTMRNDGSPALNQDERTTVSLPSGVISDEGIRAITSLISNEGYRIPYEEGMDYEKQYELKAKWWRLAHELEGALGAQWQTKEGNYTKRLSRFAYKSQGLKVPPAMLSEIGNIATANSTGQDYHVEMTRDLNQPAHAFYHEGSCWWQSYGEGRCALKTNGGIGMRTFSTNGGYSEQVSGRAWVMPLRLNENGNLVATFDSLTPDAFIVFNGYGDLSGYAPARIMAHMAGMTYRKIGFDCSPMYVNGNSGYLVAPEEIATKYQSKGNLSLYVDTHSNLFYKEEAAAPVAA